MSEDTIIADIPTMSSYGEDSDSFITNPWSSPPPHGGSNTNDDDSPPPGDTQTPISPNPSSDDGNIYYNSDYSPPSTPSITTSSSTSPPKTPSTSPSDPFNASFQLSQPLFPTPLVSMAEIYPRWTRIVRLQKGYADHYASTHQHLGIINSQLAKLNTPLATSNDDADDAHGPAKTHLRTLWHSLQKSDLQILEHAMLHVARMTREKILLQRQATMLYKHAHQRELWRQRYGEGDDAVVYAMVEGWLKKVRWVEGVRREIV